MTLHDDDQRQLHITNHPADEDYDGFRKRSPWLKGMAVLLVLAFLLLALPQLTEFFGAKTRLSQDPSLNYDPVASIARPAIVVIEAQTPEGVGMRIKKGTGFNILEDGLIITNQHVVSGAAAVSITFIDGRRYFSNHWEQVGDADIAVIDIQGRDLPTLKLDYSKPQPGQAVTVIGNPLNMERLIQKGMVAQVIDGIKGSNLAYVEILVTAAPGLSGSPVIDESGRVVAVVYAARKKAEENSTALAIPLNVLENSLEQAINRLETIDPN